MMGGAFDTFGRVTANGSGNGTVIVNGPPPGQQWELLRVSVSVPSMASTAIVPFRLYRNQESQGSLISGTRTGALDSDSSPNTIISAGEQLVAVWNSVTPGAQCTIAINYRIIGNV